MQALARAWVWIGWRGMCVVGHTSENGGRVVGHTGENGGRVVGLTGKDRFCVVSLTGKDRFRVVSLTGKNGCCVVGRAGEDGWLLGVDGLGYGDVARFGAVAMSSVVAVRANRVTAAVGWFRVDGNNLSAGIRGRDVRLRGGVGCPMAGVWWACDIDCLCGRHRNRDGFRDRGSCWIAWNARAWYP